MKKYIVFILSLLAFACKEKAVNKEQFILDRIEFVYRLKETVDQTIWKTYNDKKFDVPLLYFTDSTSYVANPTEKFTSAFKSMLIYETVGLKIYKTNERVDSLPFHMETGMTLGTPTDEYNYHSPFMKCSSVECTKATIPELVSTEQWTTMIMHEYFHGFQYKHLAYLDYYEKNIVDIQPDSLRSIYKNYDWFKNSIDKENDLLLQAINETDDLKTNGFIDSFLLLRKERRMATKEQLKFDIEKSEKCYETMEGTARYVEYSLYSHFSTLPPDAQLMKSDTAYKSFHQYKNYKIENDPWLFMTSKTSYFYAVGFNLARLLDKLKIDYKSRLFNKGDLTLEDLLTSR
jgi:hypothetical protein